MSARDEHGTVPQTVPVADLEEGDFLPGLDMGYVYIVAPADFPHGDAYREITFHTNDGDEAFLIAPGDMPVTIERRTR